MHILRSLYDLSRAFFFLGTKQELLGCGRFCGIGTSVGLVILSAGGLLSMAVGWFAGQG